MDYNLENIRELLTAGFDEQQLRQLGLYVPEFRDIRESLAKSANKDEIIDLLLDYADRNLKVEALVAWAEKRNPARYEKHKPYTFQTSSQEISRKNILSWLHLADLQFSKQRVVNNFTPMFADIETQLRATGVDRLDFIFVTGDVALTGQAAEYEQAQLYFENLLKYLGVPNDRLLIIPGNHDVNRLIVNVEPLGIKSGAEQITAEVGAALHNYTNFARSYAGGGSIPYVYQYQWNEHRVAIIGLNTALLEVNISEQEVLYTISQQTQRLLDETQATDIRIGLLHHPPEQLQQSNVPQLEPLLTRNFDFILHSHLHALNSPRLRSNQERAIVIQGGADYTSEHPNAYNLVKLDFGTGTGNIYFRQYDPERGAWLEDFKALAGGNAGIYNFQLPERLTALQRPTALVEKPPGEKSWVPPLAGYITDTATGEDRLGITNEVNAFSSVLAAKDVNPPLCLGLFGDWGSGKTFFMKKMEEQINRLANYAQEAEKKGRTTAYCTRIVQITFNAWHYADANLWASLISHIFEGLDAYITEQEKNEKKKQLVQELKLAKELQEEARHKKEAAEQHLTEVEAKLDIARQEREQKSLELHHLLTTSLSLEQILDGEQMAKLETLKKELGLPQVFQSVEEIEMAFKETRTLGGRIQAILLAPDNSVKIFVWALGMLIAISLVGIVVDWLLNWLSNTPQIVEAVAAIFSQIVIFVASIVAGIRWMLKRTTPVVNRLGEILAKARSKLQEERQRISTEEAKLMAELSDLKEREAAAQKALGEAQARVERAERALRELENINDNRRLAEFIRERLTSQDYKSQLGLISLIRKDLEFLSCKLKPTEECKKKGLGTDVAQDSNLPRVDRIILYIDDLDRCPEKHVVEVLQAIHLLLAFELFVVVVGVDPRWLRRSLEQVYPTLQAETAERAGWSEEEVWAWQSTPQNYLEKIFQIPFHLRPMEEDGFRQLIDHILLSPTPVTHQIPEDGPDGAPQPGETITDTERESSPRKPEQTETVPLASDGKDITIEDVEVVSQDEEAFDLNPSALVIGKIEQEFIARLATLIPTPRAAKRFINIYRLIRATISEEDLPIFIGDSQQPGEYRAVMSLLAILTGFPRQAPYVLRKILSSSQESQWDSMVGMLRPQRIADAATEHYHNGIMPAISAAEAVEWKRLYSALNALQEPNSKPQKLTAYIKRAPYVARFSFRLGKILSGYSLTADIKITQIENVPSSDEGIGEYVRIENLGETAQLMTNWTLSDRKRHKFTFPPFILPADSMVKVWVGEGTNTLTDLYWGRRAKVWNKDADVAELHDASNVLVSKFSYPEKNSPD